MNNVIATPKLVIRKRLPRMFRAKTLLQMTQRVDRFTNKIECFWCGDFYRKSELTDDHLVPLGAGGGRSAFNVVRACKECNHDRGRIVGAWVRCQELAFECENREQVLRRWLNKLPERRRHQAQWVEVEHLRLGFSPSEKLTLVVPQEAKPMTERQRRKYEQMLAARQAEKQKRVGHGWQIHRWADDGGNQWV